MKMKQEHDPTRLRRYRASRRRRRMHRACSNDRVRSVNWFASQDSRRSLGVTLYLRRYFFFLVRKIRSRGGIMAVSRPPRWFLQFRVSPVVAPIFRRPRLEPFRCVAHFVERARSPRRWGAPRCGVQVAERRERVSALGAVPASVRGRGRRPLGPARDRDDARSRDAAFLRAVRSNERTNERREREVRRETFCHACG